MSYTDLFLVSLAITLVVETPVVILTIKLLKEKINIGRVIGVALVASSLTLPYLWFIFNEYLEYWQMAIFGEIFVFIVETTIYWKFLPISFKKAVLISLVANVASIIVGLLL